LPRDLVKCAGPAADAQTQVKILIGFENMRDSGQMEERQKTAEPPRGHTL
jgi:hypothetical protein